MSDGNQRSMSVEQARKFAAAITTAADHAEDAETSDCGVEINLKTVQATATAHFHRSQFKDDE